MTFRVLLFIATFLVFSPIALYLLTLVRFQLHGPTINPNSTCPGCGGNSGKLKFVGTSPHGQPVPKPEPMIEHTCLICEAKWYEAPVLQADKWIAP